MNKRLQNTDNQVRSTGGQTQSAQSSNLRKGRPRLIGAGTGGGVSPRKPVAPQQSPQQVAQPQKSPYTSTYSGKTVLPKVSDNFDAVDFDHAEKKMSAAGTIALLKNIARYFVGSFVGIALVFAGFFSYRIYTTSRAVLDDSIAGDSIAFIGEGQEIDPALLMHEGDSRVNILLVGIRGDDDGYWDGSIQDFQIDLADTIIVASIDPVQKTAGLFSIPRDLYVDIPQFGGAKINNATQWGEDIGYQGGGVGLLIDSVEQNLEIPLHYYAQINLDGFISIVDTIGGVDVFVQDTIIDYEFTFEELGYAPPYVIEAGSHRLDGREALAYSRSRKTSARGDFDRNDRQRAMLFDLKDKALSSGTYTDPLKVSGILTALSDNFRTNIPVSTMLDLQRLTNDIPTSSISSAGISTDDDSFLYGTQIDSASVLVPRSGNFNEVTNYFFETFPDRLIQSENASVDVFYMNNYYQDALDLSGKLEALGYNVGSEVLPTNEFGETVLFASDAQTHKYTNAYLNRRLDVSGSQSINDLPAQIQSSSDFVIIVGRQDVSTF